MSEIKPYTPVPWIRTKIHNCPYLFSHVPDSGPNRYVASFPEDDPRFEQDIAYMLHAANSHASLAAEVERLRAALESARAEALEEAAKVAEGFESIPSDRMNYGDYIAAAIRELAKG